MVLRLGLLVALIAFLASTALCQDPKPGAMTLFQASPQEHFALAKHLTAEIKTEEFIAGRGVVVKWERRRKQNHWFDALYNACAASYYCGVRLVEEKKVERPAPKRTEPQPHFTRRDGSPWIDTERWQENWGRYRGSSR